MGEAYTFQAEIALIGLSTRASKLSEESPEQLASPGIDAAFLQILRILSDSRNIPRIALSLSREAAFLEKRCHAPLPQDATTWPEFAALTRRLAKYLSEAITEFRETDFPWKEMRAPQTTTHLNIWADTLERAIAAREQQRTKKKSQLVAKIKGQRKTASRRAHHEPRR